MTLEELLERAQKERLYIQIFGNGACEIQHPDEDGWYEQDGDEPFAKGQTLREAMVFAVDRLNGQARMQADEEAKQAGKLFFT